MFYGTCSSACPMLITAMQVYESRLDESSQSRLRVLQVSFDAERDTPEQLDRLARLHRSDPVRRTFANAAEPDVRRLAAVLGISYRRLPGGAFDHSLLITLLDGDGRILASTTTLIDDKNSWRSCGPPHAPTPNSLDKPAPAAVAASTYGRPTVKRG
jgi:protein SCO1